MGHDGTIQGSRTFVAATGDGRHVVSFNVNADWPRLGGHRTAVQEAEFCG